jgi:hypothetical protein
MTTEEYFERLSSLVLEFTFNYKTKFINQIISKQRYTKEPEKFFYVVIHKTVCSLEGANIFVRNFDSRKDYHVPLFLILRTILSDILTAEHITHCSETDEHSEELIEEIYFDHMYNVIKSCQKSFRQIYQWSEKETEENINLLKSQSRFYDENGVTTRKSISKSLAKLIVDIYASKKDKESLIFHRRAFDLYGMFSKYEHLGELSFYLFHRSYEDNNQKALQLDLHDSITFIIAALMSYKNVWEDIEHDKEYFKRLQKNIEEMNPKMINTA